MDSFVFWQKKTSQYNFLKNQNFKSELKDAIIQARNKILKIVSEIKGFKERKVKRETNSTNYKHNGFSYVMTLVLSDKSIQHFDGNIDSSLEKWIKIEDFEGIKGSKSDIICSWSVVSITNSYNFESLVEEMNNNENLKSLIECELWIQNRWFLIDATLENVKNKLNKIKQNFYNETLLKIIDTELQTDFSANMGTFKNKIIVALKKTSGILNHSKSIIEKSKKRFSIFLKTITTFLSVGFSILKIIEVWRQNKNTVVDIATLILILGVTVIVIFYIVFEAIKNRRK
ncbi:hypothetical protein NPA07_00020 [Mycoplasmopsis caviae]|uniref:Uncharacterized protein n=1 Tax=Mycoplasmopsis caviae TaxID=55603 RepID=A0A3P8K993_9BACT|nr:hypothetical protein [Mycoplasmopsis caviae]UUD35256.1 hypothetical protein NPA07_00020 [Mycoplasmopsis caviae]VDR41959.1 Uncharacterised protein [Mycoplasmopsis caviae]